MTVEDKGASLALHYRLSRHREQALALIEDVLSPPAGAWHVFGGKMVVNAVASQRAGQGRCRARHGGALRR
jgi:trehalose 6-phosphate phosphatase